MSGDTKRLTPAMLEEIESRAKYFLDVYELESEYEAMARCDTTDMARNVLALVAMIRALEDALRMTEADASIEASYETWADLSALLEAIRLRASQALAQGKEAQQ